MSESHRTPLLTLLYRSAMDDIDVEVTGLGCAQFPTVPHAITTSMVPNALNPHGLSPARSSTHDCRCSELKS